MRTTLNIDDEILEKASRLTGVKEKAVLVRLGLQALIARESSKRSQGWVEPEKISVQLNAVSGKRIWVSIKNKCLWEGSCLH